jgi:hypothetical protein
MVRANIKGVFCTYKNLRDGSRKPYWYHRHTGLRLRGLPGSPEFISDLAAADLLVSNRLGGAFNGLIREYTLSPEFGTLAPSTQAEYRRMLTIAEKQFGSMPVTALNDPRVKMDFLDWRAKTARLSGEREADNRLSVISAMLTWAVECGRAQAPFLGALKHGEKIPRLDDLLAGRPQHQGAVRRLLDQLDVLVAHVPKQGRKFTLAKGRKRTGAT